MVVATLGLALAETHDGWGADRLSSSRIDVYITGDGGVSSSKTVRYENIGSTTWDSSSVVLSYRYESGDDGWNGNTESAFRCNDWPSNYWAARVNGTVTPGNDGSFSLRFCNNHNMPVGTYTEHFDIAHSGEWFYFDDPYHYERLEVRVHIEAEAVDTPTPEPTTAPTAVATSIPVVTPSGAAWDADPVGIPIFDVYITGDGGTSESITVQYSNIGDNSWSSSLPVVLSYRYEPENDSGWNNNTESAFRCDDWPSENNYWAAKVSPSSVSTGETGSFTIRFCNNNNQPDDVYTEHFDIAHGGEWFFPDGWSNRLTVRIHVGQQPTPTPTAAPEPGTSFQDVLNRVNELCDSGQISHQGTCTSLQQKLNNAIAKCDRGQDTDLHAFINSVEAQRGKKIPADIADELIDMATGATCDGTPAEGLYQAAWDSQLLAGDESGPFVMTPFDGESETLWVKFTNTGEATWTADNVLLKPQARDEQGDEANADFACNGLEPFAALVDGPVAPGETGTFELTLCGNQHAVQQYVHGVDFGLWVVSKNEFMANPTNGNPWDKANAWWNVELEGDYLAEWLNQNGFIENDAFTFDIPKGDVKDDMWVSFKNVGLPWSAGQVALFVYDNPIQDANAQPLCPSSQLDTDGDNVYDYEFPNIYNYADLGDPSASGFPSQSSSSWDNIETGQVVTLDQNVAYGEVATFTFKLRANLHDPTVNDDICHMHYVLKMKVGEDWVPIHNLVNGDQREYATSWWEVKDCFIGKDGIRYHYPFYACNYKAVWEKQESLKHSSNEQGFLDDVYPGDLVELKVELKNAGLKTWYRENRKDSQASAEEKNRQVCFNVYKDPDSGYLSAPLGSKYNDKDLGESYWADEDSWGDDQNNKKISRVGCLQEESVAPGETGTFILKFYIPYDTPFGSYREDISLAAGQYWMENTANGDKLNVMHIWVGFNVVSSHWKTISSGVQYAEVNGDYIAKIDLRNPKVGVTVLAEAPYEGLSLLGMAGEAGARLYGCSVIVNGTPFDEDYPYLSYPTSHPVAVARNGSWVVSPREYNQLTNYKSDTVYDQYGALAFDKLNSGKIVLDYEEKDKFSGHDYNIISGYQRFLLENIYDIWGSKGEDDPFSAVKGKDKRTVFALSEDGTELTLIVTGQWHDYSAEDIYNRILKNDLDGEINTHNAILMDGGGSSRIAVRIPFHGGYHDRDPEHNDDDWEYGNRDLINALCIYEKPDTGMTIPSTGDHIAFTSDTEATFGTFTTVQQARQRRQTEQVVVTYTNQLDLDTGGLVPVGNGYLLEASFTDGQPAIPAEPYLITRTYRTEDIPTGVDADSIGFYNFINGQWVRDESSDVNPNTITAQPTTLGLWAILAEPKVESKVYLPLVVKQ
ncbi:phosphodiester glycosidase family protein [Anaerolineales bacterium HSG24]|nr:phosphodiester glycosidase family protein [Anaerolineales bacterium HSG24]